MQEEVGADDQGVRAGTPATEFPIITMPLKRGSDVQQVCLTECVQGFGRKQSPACRLPTTIWLRGFGGWAAKRKVGLKPKMICYGF